ncbi:MAG: hypothetical protein ACK513_08495 [Aphanizomenon sp.]|jgi:hypothetical protein|uniref:Uncharacterized protein n=1 Tax=Aphanizomenon flos-aquae LD13 TaxID=1710894 RepID=A0A1B7W183_APHFL|nr:hypothetical protein [Aphanizomenon flos-aquae UKL13-PB]OBQ27041.1 MAG: hypothetical protein AN481_02020 [Aphanizomenon flos-aquae LD13]HCQ22201.1 hypothetical protein [Anabaena sp. UBA12330]
MKIQIENKIVTIKGQLKEEVVLDASLKPATKLTVYPRLFKVSQCLIATFDIVAQIWQKPSYKGLVSH